MLMPRVGRRRTGPATGARADGPIWPGNMPRGRQRVRVMGWAFLPGALCRKQLALRAKARPTRAAYPRTPRQQADYWRQRGRGDLADALTGQTHSPAYSRESPVVPGRDASAVARPRAADEAVRRESLPMARTMPGSYATTRYARQDGESGQAGGVMAQDSQAIHRNPAASAEYWQRRGRPDMAARLRQQLQADPQPIRQPPRNPDRAAQQTGRGSGDGGASALEQSLRDQPGRAAVRLELASVYREAGELGKARAQIDAVLASHPDAPDALFASAQLYADQQMWRDALQTLERISPVSRSAEMGRLQKTAWAHVQIDRADVLARQGMNAEAEVLLRRVATELAMNPGPANLTEPPALWGAGGGSRQRQR